MTAITIGGKSFELAPPTLGDIEDINALLTAADEIKGIAGFTKIVNIALRGIGQEIKRDSPATLTDLIDAQRAVLAWAGFKAAETAPGNGAAAST